MDDPTVGIVQSPQFFDTPKQTKWIQRCAGETQELFYRFIQPSRDALGAAVCVGTSALYRRIALEAIGGLPKIGQSEDIYTGLWMLDAGYSTRYVPVTVSKGVAASNLDNFIAQQYRWCEGSMTMLATSRFHTSPNVPLPTRLCFWSGFLYYVSTALSSLIIPLPAITMAWFFPQWVRPWTTIWLAGALLLVAGRLPAGHARPVADRGAACPNRLRLRPRFQHRPPSPEPGRRMAPDQFQSARTHSGQGQAVLHRIPRPGLERGRRRSDNAHRRGRAHAVRRDAGLLRAQPVRRRSARSFRHRRRAPLPSPKARVTETATGGLRRLILSHTGALCPLTLPSTAVLPARKTSWTP